MCRCRLVMDCTGCDTRGFVCAVFFVCSVLVFVSCCLFLFFVLFFFCRRFSARFLSLSVIFFSRDCFSFVLSWEELLFGVVHGLFCFVCTPPRSLGVFSFGRLGGPRGASEPCGRCGGGAWSAGARLRAVTRQATRSSIYSSL
jgi:hypothetical protein